MFEVFGVLILKKKNRQVTGYKPRIYGLTNRGIACSKPRIYELQIGELQAKNYEFTN